MEISRAQQLFRAGALEEVVIEPADAGNGWMVLVRSRDGVLARITDHAGTEKVYHTVDHATEVAKSIGFDTVRVEERF